MRWRLKDPKTEFIINTIGINALPTHFQKNKVSDSIIDAFKKKFLFLVFRRMA